MRWEKHPDALASSTPEQWRAMGFDADSVVAAPMFVDAGRGDYRLKPGSPALKLGFVLLPLERIGIRPREKG
jgi:hypothetical protein